PSHKRAIVQCAHGTSDDRRLYPEATHQLGVRCFRCCTAQSRLAAIRRAYRIAVSRGAARLKYESVLRLLPRYRGRSSPGIPWAPKDPCNGTVVAGLD